MSPTSSVNHYENFPVASVLIPAKMRAPIASIYWFARSADDIADEGKALPSARLAALGVYRQQLNIIASGAMPAHPQFAKLAEHIREFNLPITLLGDLITAFESDCTKKRHADWSDLQHYCKHSANPVGRLMLHLFNRFTEDRALASDQVCTGLQLTNFLQDIRHDWAIGRLYIPLDELAAYGLSEQTIADAAKSRIVSEKLEALLQMQHQRAADHLSQGSRLLPELPGRLGLEIAATVAGGQQILQHLSRQQFAGFSGRPKLGGADWIKIAGRVIASRFK